MKELRDLKKATFKRLPSNDGACSWTNTSEEDMKAGLGLFDNNNASKSPFGSLTNQVNTFSMIGLTNVGGMAMERQNSDFNIGVECLCVKNEPSKSKGKLFIITYFIILTCCF